MTESLTQAVLKYFDESKLISAAEVPFDQEVRKLCEQNSCGKFDTCWTCPPAAGSIETLQKKLEGLDNFLLFYKVYPLEDSFDWEGMMDSAKDFQKQVAALKNDIEKEHTDLNHLVLGAGSCQVCETCTYPQKEPCRFPEKAQSSVESFGIDAMKMMRDNGLKYNNGPNTVTYIGGIFYK